MGDSIFHLTDDYTAAAIREAIQYGTITSVATSLVGIIIFIMLALKLHFKPVEEFRGTSRIKKLLVRFFISCALIFGTTLCINVGLLLKFAWGHNLVVTALCKITQMATMLYCIYCGSRIYRASIHK